MRAAAPHGVKPLFFRFRQGVPNMNDEEIRYSVSFNRIARPDLEGMDFEEAERALADRLSAERSLDALNDMLWLYRAAGCEDRARACLDVLLEDEQDLEMRALYHVYAGQSYERTGEYDDAIRQYRAAMGLEPSAPFTAYYLYNNLGYCLNLNGQYEDGERLCRMAIRVDPSRPNAHQNLGISLAALGQLRAAADAWIAATRANAADDRALGLLEAMLADRPELSETDPELRAQIADCRKAVAFARDVMSDV